MISFRKDTSFPFLKIACEQGVPYEKVLRLVEQLQISQLGEIKALVDRSPLIAIIVRAMDVERDRRAKILES